MSELAQQKCIPCEGGVPALQGDEIARYQEQLASDWQVVDAHHLLKDYNFENFVEALAFTNKVGEVAEAEGHHPDIYLAWGKVGIKIWTHKIDGLSVSDFILAAKIDRIYA
ncbi:MAG: 4a-hydroxytetrahydrobiopterin dehydratase [Myxococcales bacterium]|nr:4a-hydroxytetrahydrobiopterin dehydratase [Myxococcales bacterium]|tara:strand:+ start:42 stop:374 length:333 start_codon:yes stop_codon:yes gene_type:complete